MTWRNAGPSACLLTSVLFGLTPVFSLRRLDLTRDLKESNRQLTGSARPWTSALVSAEVALAFVLLTSTGLLMHTFINILHTDPRPSKKLLEQGRPYNRRHREIG